MSRYGKYVGWTWTRWCKKVYVYRFHFGRLRGRWDGGWT